MSWIKASGARVAHIRLRHQRGIRLRLEPLESRRLLSTCHVVRLGDFGAGADLGGGQSRGDLRYCINKTNIEAGTDTILLERAGTINLTGALPNLADDVLIAGPGSDQATIRRDTGGNYRIFTVDTGVTAQLFGMTIRSGLVAGSGNAGSGGGILNLGTLILLGDVTVAENQAQNGGGIYSAGEFTAYFTTISNNIAASADCSNLLIASNGGGVYALSGAASIYHSTVAANDACRGGGIFNRASLTLTDVSVTGNESIRQGGGIYNESAMDIGSSVISDNVAGDGAGGGILNTSSVTIDSSTITRNLATVAGGGISSAGSAEIDASTVAENRAPVGGGISSGGLLMIHGSTITENVADGDDIVTTVGGGIRAQGTVEIENSAIIYNIAHNSEFADFSVYAYGGGIGIENGTVILLNSTVSHNVAESLSNQSFNHVYGGGIAHRGSGNVSIAYSTIAYNSCIGKFSDDEYGGGVYQESLQIDMHNSIIAYNTSNWGNDIYADLNSFGYNLISTSSGGNGYAPTDILDVDPLLGPLQDNGGPTQTHALLPGSPAIDGGDPNPADPPEWDQRGPGFPRIVNGRLDIGAFEVQATGLPNVSDASFVLATADLSDVFVGRPRRRSFAR